MRVIMLGLDNAGKTTILQFLKDEDTLNTKPTYGFNIEHIERNSMSMCIWDFGGNEQVRDNWTHHVPKADALIFVVDSVDSDRMDLVRDKLHEVFSHEEVHDLPLLIFANKQDQAEALNYYKLKEMLDLDEILPSCKIWKMQPCCGLEGSGVTHGFNWLTKVLKLTL